MDGVKITEGVAHLTGSLTFTTVGDRFQNSKAWFDTPDPVTTLDLANVGNVDSAGLALLLEWQSQARGRGAKLLVRNAPNDLLRLAALAEASDLLGLPPVPGLAHDQLG